MASGPPAGGIGELLGAFTSPDNGVRRRAEEAWEDMKMRLPDQVLEQVCAVLGQADGGEGGEGLRAMAAVLLRTLFDIRSDVWFRVQQQTQAGVKATLLDRLTKEPVAHIRRKLTHAIGQLAGISSATGEWPELMALTVALCDAAQQSPEMKVVGLDLVNILAEFCPGMMSPHQDGLLQMFGASLEDPTIGVRVAALKAACSFLQDSLSGPSAAVAPSLVPRIMSVVEATVNAGDESAAGDVLEALNVIAANQPLLLLGESGDQTLEMVSTAMLTLAGSPALETSTRELSLEVFTGLCECAPSVLRERGATVVNVAVPLTINMLAQPPQDFDDEEELGSWLSMSGGNGRGDEDADAEGGELSMIAASALSRMAVALGGKAVLSSAMPVCSELLGDATNWRRRKAGLLTLLLIGELLPTLVESLGGPNANMPRLEAAAAGALITFCNPERLSAEWLYAATPGRLGGEAVGLAMLRSLSGLVTGSSSVVVREEALTAVGCAAREILSATASPPPGGGGTTTSTAAPQDTDLLRGKAMEAIALMGQAVGLEVFREDAHQVIRLLLNEQGMVARDPANPQSTYTLQSLARMAGVLVEEFLPYLSEAVKPLLVALSINAEIKHSNAPDAALAKDELEAEGLTAMAVDLRGVGRQVFGVNTSLMQAKESACKTLYQYTEDLGEGFAPHAAETLAVVIPNLGPRNAIGVQVISSAIVPKLVALAEGRAAEAVAAGAGAKEVQEAQQQKPSVIRLSDERLLKTVTGLRNVAAASIGRTRAALAAAAAAAAAAGGGLGGQGGMTGAIDAAELRELEDGEEELLVSVVDATGWMIKGRKEAFLPAFEAVMRPLVLQLLDPAAPAAVPPSHRSFGLCMAIDVLEHCGEGGRNSVFQAPLLPALLQGARGDDPAAASTRQACAYGLGVAAELGGQDFDAHSAEALGLLLALVRKDPGGDNDDDDGWGEGAVRDNAVSAAFRVLIHRPGPVFAAFPPAVVGSLLDSLPITVDVAEGQVCHRRVVDLAFARHELFFGGGGDGTFHAAAVVPKLVTAIAGMMEYQSRGAGGDGYGSQEELWERQLVDRETREKAEEVVAVVKTAFAGGFQRAWEGLGEAGRRALQTPTSSVCSRAEES
ncbi:conserved unknown protein [Ectocarpus siliculosus]|uniref:IPO4/5-like TPR repeats domain-containing protein n=1 Tax=Ectocarpus siliculosus TaxID=2880 RepID=D7FNE2_ECTSI|nr:conserved unknown protein [Ectocarpus siliculosus]|eukprot:CBJ30196.1 conserved unknown protein [Ectocarpus siliculosus]